LTENYIVMEKRSFLDTNKITRATKDQHKKGKREGKGVLAIYNSFLGGG